MKDISVLYSLGRNKQVTPPLTKPGQEKEKSDVSVGNPADIFSSILSSRPEERNSDGNDNE
jgi:hypothetical protein